MILAKNILGNKALMVVRMCMTVTITIMTMFNNGSVLNFLLIMQYGFVTHVNFIL